MQLSDQRGAAAVLTLVLAVVSIVLMGILLDIGLMAVVRERLDQATEAAARAAVQACAPADEACLRATAEQYLKANLDPASIDSLTVELTGRLVLASSVDVPLVFSSLFGSPPAHLDAKVAMAPR